MDWWWVVDCGQVGGRIRQLGGQLDLVVCYSEELLATLGAT